MSIRNLFPSPVYVANAIPHSRQSRWFRSTIDECYQIAKTDTEGQKWSLKNYPGGYTSYASLNQLHQFSTTFDEIRKKIDAHVAKYARAMEMDIKSSELKMSNFWLNIMPSQVVHTMHIHPLSVISGTFYLQVPRGASSLKFEDPRLACFMASPPRKAKARSENQRFISFQPEAGQIILFESWMRHEVPPNQSPSDRISISFNYEWTR